jgi:hypothetical protein
MSTETKGTAHPEPKRAKERSVWDVAKEAFENRLIEGDRPTKTPISTQGNSG